MYPRLHFMLHFVVAVAVSLASVVAANAQETAAAPATASLHGHITDPSGALIPGAAVTLTSAAGAHTAIVKADAAGAYELRSIAPGNYYLGVTYDGFAPFQSQAIALAAGQTKRIDVAMAVAVEQQNVVVTDESPAVSVEAGSNASSIVIKGKDLDALSDDPDELSNELSALAGPSAGPNGGQIYIDGFTGGTLPPKSAIREIRINQNPFSAEFDRLGYGRIEILTKPGTDKLHGQFFGMGNDKSFNTGSPFAKNLPDYHSYMLNGSISGSLSKTASFFASVQQRNTSDAYVYYADFGTVDNTTVIESGGLYSPHVRTNISPRIDLQLGSRNTLTLRYQFERENGSNILASTYDTPSQATGSKSIEHTVQASDAFIVSDRIVNETRFQYRRTQDTGTSASDTPVISVAQYFTTGGASSQSSNEHDDDYELQNITTTSIGAHAIKFGTRLRGWRIANSTDANFNGTFSFGSTAAYQALLADLAAGMTFSEISAACTADTNATCALPNQLTYTTGPIAASTSMFDASLFFQDDWKVNRFLTVSGGLRWESQNHVSDHNDWAPRVAFAYALDGHAKGAQPKTVWRGGFGIFYDRFSASNLLTIARQSGSANSQTVTTISKPTCFDATSLSNIDLSTCGTGTTTSPTIERVDPTYHSPYTEQIGTSIERQITKKITGTVTYLHSFGVHQLVTRDANAYLPGTFQYGSDTLTGTRPDTSLGIVNEFYPEAVFKQDQIIANWNARINPSFSLFGFYNWTRAKTDGAGGTASNSYNLTQDYGRASFASSNMVFLMASVTAPWGIRVNPFLMASSGKPYNITTTNDLTGDNFYNDRPGLADSSLCEGSSTRYAQTSFGCFDTTPDLGYTPIAMNLGTGPAAVAMNLRISRTMGIGPKIQSTTQDGQRGGPGGPPPGGGRGGPGGGGPGGGLGPGGLNGGGGGPRGMFGGTTARKYNLTFSVDAMNLFNNVNYGTPVGTVTPTYDSTTGITNGGTKFGRSNSLASGMFASPTGDAVRRIMLQAIFSF
ncbi:MAG: carboxypeptidase regulatory-like domain-containing protein [Acidobacteriaceae bacterium]|nr:carboxypeptidase regulatory-like domain-containing protein [Acidobacteriaceae bacterium]